VSLAATIPWWQILFMILVGVFAGIGAWHFWNWGQTITSGLREVAPALGMMVGSIGMLFALMPSVLMIMMFMWMFSSLMRVFGE
jgi:hypothetical protein